MVLRRREAFSLPSLVIIQYVLSRNNLLATQVVSGGLAILTGGLRAYFLRAGWWGPSNGFDTSMSYLNCNPL